MITHAEEIRIIAELEDAHHSLWVRTEDALRRNMRSDALPQKSPDSGCGRGRSRHGRKEPVTKRIIRGKAMRFRKKPIVIEAVQWDGTEKCLKETMLPFILDGHDDFSHLPDNGSAKGGPALGFTPPDGSLTIPTLEGDHRVNPGDWVIKGVKGIFYPCMPELFKMTYEAVEDDG